MFVLSVFLHTYANVKVVKQLSNHSELEFYIHKKAFLNVEI